MKTIIAPLTAAAILSTGSALADQYTTAVSSTGWQGLGAFNTALTLPQFNPSLGTLTGVTLHTTSCEEAGITIENGGAISAGMTLSLAGVIESVSGNFDILSNMSGSFGPFSLDASDNPPGPPIAYNQSGSDYQDLGTLSTIVSKTVTAAQAGYTDLSTFVGYGTIAFDVSASGGWSASGSEAYNLTINNFRGKSDIYIDYIYTPVPVSVPEPTSLALIGLGALALIARRRP